ncbi:MULTISPECIES: PP2C family protein-serine/threonine phosphatase [unclassified Streptomyces]|uniref:PP2C family protein-serine/threonine phosphatase n=1 Tax=unclassified Streptomyces TaxID=2593676 RepID=UPI000DBA6026|nr:MULTISPECIES: PP2C family protein-serine/threonine phosphatase [unclassified Streptomyces]MYT73577.1 SpoIIE family protein phosphatase [Streptomyces sp. SID8367]RAJ85114.1 stage II sporulation protein E [Streptomyces sp. PsTaAH-137]
MTVPESAEGLLGEFLADPRNLPLDLVTAVARASGALGLRGAVVYIADIQQRRLTPLNATVSPLAIDTSLAGWSYRTQSLRVEEDDEGLTAWLPLIDGSERLGVLAVKAPALDSGVLRRGRALAALLAMMVTSKRTYKDSFVRRSRTAPMELPAELLRAYLPPRTIGTGHTVSTAVLEPAYQVGGDAYDHALSENALHAGIVDAVGHNLASGLTAVVSLAACRNARRTGADLPDVVAAVDDALIEWLPDQFCTAVLARVDLSTGLMRWVNCGHPPPLLIRDQNVLVGALERRAQPPMGYTSRFISGPRDAHEFALKPGDRVLMYTDGVTEARTADGSELGLERFADHVIRATATGELAPETLRRLIHSLLDAQDHRLRDDATILMFEWRPVTP